MKKLQITVEDAINDIEEEECGECSESEYCSDCEQRYLDEKAERDLEYELELRAGIWQEYNMTIKINGHDLPVHISYSSLTTWLDCGWKYYLTRIEKVEERPTWYLVGGSAVHTATEQYDLELFAKEQR